MPEVAYGYGFDYSDDGGRLVGHFHPVIQYKSFITVERGCFQVHLIHSNTFLYGLIRINRNVDLKKLAEKLKENKTAEEVFRFREKIKDEANVEKMKGIKSFYGSSFRRYKFTGSFGIPASA